MTKEIAKWSDDFMFKAEESNAADGPQVFLLGAPTDPLGQIAACAKMYKGEVVRDLADVTDEERKMYLEEIQKTVLKMPMEAVHMHFMIEGVTRGFTHQMVRQRTAAYAQESTRFAVKEDMKTATALPPSLEGTWSLEEIVQLQIAEDADRGFKTSHNDAVEIAWKTADAKQRARFKWDHAVDTMGDAYMEMVNDGIPAEDARGLLPTNITTRLNYITNLRSWYDTMAVRVSDQAQFEWRKVAMHMALAMRDFGGDTTYRVWVKYEDIEWGLDKIIKYDSREIDAPGLMEVVHKRALVERTSYWQYEALSNELKPIEFKIGGPAFGANFDRPSRIGERVRAFHSKGVPSSEWTTGSVEHGIPPVHPNEWLLDPNSARLADGMEFDIFGNRVPKGTGWHWDNGFLYRVVEGASPQQLQGQRLQWPNDFDPAKAE